MNRHIKAAVIALSFIVVLAGCGIFRYYGKFQIAHEVTASFEKHEVREDFHYYISGAYMHPNAILGLDRRYRLDNDLWHKVEMTPELMRDFVGGMRTRAAQIGIRHSLFGFDLLDQKGNRIGTWYSLMSATTSFRVDGNLVTVATPDLDTYSRFEREGINSP